VVVVPLCCRVSGAAWWSSRSPLDACTLLCNCRNTGALIAQNMEALRAEMLCASSACLDSRAASSASASFDAATSQVRAHTTLVVPMSACHGANSDDVMLPYSLRSCACAGSAMAVIGSGGSCRPPPAGVLAAQDGDAHTHVASSGARAWMPPKQLQASSAQPARSSQSCATVRQSCRRRQMAASATESTCMCGMRCVINAILYHQCTNTSFVAAPACRLVPVVRHFV
jgi:hypothetical protein